MHVQLAIASTACSDHLLSPTLQAKILIIASDSQVIAS